MRLLRPPKIPLSLAVSSKCWQGSVQGATDVSPDNSDSPDSVAALPPHGRGKGISTLISHELREGVGMGA